MTDNKFDPNKMQPFLEEAAKKLGTSSESLAKQLNGGDLSAALKNMPANQRQMLNKALADKTACQKILESPQAQAILRKLSGK